MRGEGPPHPRELIKTVGASYTCLGQAAIIGWDGMSELGDTCISQLCQGELFFGMTNLIGSDGQDSESQDFCHA